MDWVEKLQKYYSYDSFIKPQHKIVKDTAKRYDQLVILPTGSGKSICYQLPAIVSQGFSIIISPLKALIKDQIDNLKKRGIPVLSFYGDTTKKEKELLASEIYNHENTYHIIYICRPALPPRCTCIFLPVWINLCTQYVSVRCQCVMCVLYHVCVYYIYHAPFQTFITIILPPLLVFSFSFSSHLCLDPST
jgi:hypothetical protein